MAKAKRKTPSAQAKDDLVSMGYACERVEQRLPIPGKFVTRDLYGCIDLLGMQIGAPLLAVQATSRPHVSTRMKKSREMALTWVSTGNRFEVWGYGENGCRRVRMLASGEWEEVS